MSPPLGLAPEASWAIFPALYPGTLSNHVEQSPQPLTYCLILDHEEQKMSSSCGVICQDSLPALLNTLPTGLS